MLSECVATPPDRLTIVGVDHKGGATFRDLEHLPHVVGVATDLDAAGTSRVLTSLEAELAGRERLLERHAVTAWRELPAAARPPRLLVVVDEFRTLLDALPEAAGRLERLAAQGRSLGMGLILATQRPAGAVSAQLRANLALRICFRVATEADSLDVLGSADAAGIDPAKPGSCVIASAGRPPIALRVRMVPPPPRRPATEVSWPAQWAPPPAAPADPASLVNAIQRAAAAAGAKAPAAPWRPPLPTELPVASLIWPGKAGGRTGSHGAKVAGGDGEGRENTGSLFNGVLLGLVDRPALQIQESLVWDPATGHLAILGPPRSGRTTAAVTAAAGLAAAGWDTHVITHRPDAFRGLLGMARLGSVVDGRASDLIAELLGRLGREPVAVVLDAPAELEACVIGALARPLIEAIVQGALAPGAAVVVTAAAKPARWLSLCPHRLILPVSDLTDALTLGIPRELAGGARIPGRACYLGGDSAAMAQIALTTAAAGAARPAGTRTRSEGQRGYSGPVYPQDPGRSNLQTPKRVLELPDQVCSAELPPDAPGIIWVGLGGHYGTALGLPLRQAQPIAVIGPPGSGRSTILATWRQRLEAAGHPVTMPGCGGQRRWPEIIDALAAGQVVLADDLESVSGPPPSALPPKGTLIASYTTTTAAALRPPTQLFHANPLGLLLGPGGRGPAAAFGPGANTGSPLGLSGGSVPAQPPGRGRLIVGSKSYAIQAAA
jgi:S-DNA-T family DNA segregation ATPase FtsK/SpoIIIE